MSDGFHYPPTGDLSWMGAGTNATGVVMVPCDDHDTARDVRDARRAAARDNAAMTAAARLGVTCEVCPHTGALVNPSDPCEGFGLAFATAAARCMYERDRATAMGEPMRACGFGCTCAVAQLRKRDAQREARLAERDRYFDLLCAGVDDPVKAGWMVADWKHKGRPYHAMEKAKQINRWTHNRKARR